MRQFGRFLGGVLMIAGVGGLVHEFIGWFRLWAVVRYLDFLEGYEILANIVLIVIGFLVVMVSEHDRSTSS